MLGWSQELDSEKRLHFRLDKGSVDDGIYQNPLTGLELTPDLKYERSSCRLARLSGGEFLFSGDETSSLLRLFLFFWLFLFGRPFLCRFLFSGGSGGFSLGFRSWLIRSRLVCSRGWFRRFRTI